MKKLINVNVNELKKSNENIIDDKHELRDLLEKYVRENLNDMLYDIEDHYVTIRVTEYVTYSPRIEGNYITLGDYIDRWDSTIDSFDCSCGYETRSDGSMTDHLVDIFIDENYEWLIEKIEEETEFIIKVEYE